jgi:hypothetical protein
MKPIVNAGEGGPPSEVTEYTRNMDITAWIVGSATEWLENAIIDTDNIVQPIIFEHGYDENGGPGAIINIDEIEEKYVPNVLEAIPNKKYNYIFPDFQAQVDAYNEGKPVGQHRSLWTKAANPSDDDPPFYNLKIGTDVLGIADDCFKDYSTPRATTRFSGNITSIGKSAFEKFGVGTNHEFKNMVGLNIQQRAFHSANCGDTVILTFCDVGEADYAFQNAEIDYHLKIFAGQGDKIPNYFAQGAKLVLIQLEMQDNVPIGDYAFEDCGSQSLVLWDGCTAIGEYAFSRNNFEYLLGALPASIENYGDYCFQASNIKKLSISPNPNAVFGAYCFQNNNIDNLETNYLELQGREFKYRSFRNAIRQLNSQDTFRVVGSNLREECFSQNSFHDISMEGEIVGDSAFRDCFIPNGTVDIKAPINGRHAFSQNTNSYSTRTYVLDNPSHLSNSFRTFQRGNFQGGDFPRPVGAILYFPLNYPSSFIHDTFNATEDLGAFTYGEAVAYSERNPGAIMDWRTVSPESLVVNFGSDIVTLELPDPVDISGTLSTIQPGGFYSQYFSGTSGAGATGNGSVGYYYYDISVRYSPWNATVVDYNEISAQQGCDTTTLGKSVWIVEGNSNDYAPLSPVFWEAPLSDPAGVSINRTHPTNHYAADIASVSFVETSLQLPVSGQHPAALVADSMGDASDHLYLQPDFSGDSSAFHDEKLYVPSIHVNTVDNDNFRKRHSFLGDVIGY